VLALGRPKETVGIEPVDHTGSIRYCRVRQSVHHVPKRRLEDIIVEDKANF